MKRNLTSFSALATAVTLATATASVHATTYTWNFLTGNGQWSNASNWTPTGGPPNGVGHVANLTGDLTANSQVTVPATTTTVGGVTIGDASGTNTYTLQSNTLTFDNTGSNDAYLTKVGGGSDTVSTSIQLNDRLIISNTNTGTNNTTPLTITSTISGSAGITFNSSQPTPTALNAVGAASFTASNLIFNGTGNHTGTTVFDSGTVVLNSGGSSLVGTLGSTSELVFRGGNIVVRNGSSNTNNDRINDAAVLRVQAAGAFVYRTANTGYTASESVGALTLETGTFLYRNMSDTPLNFSSTVTFADLVRSGSGNNSFATFGSGTSVLGAGGTGTGTGHRLILTNINNAPATNTAFLGGWATYGNGASFAAYDTTNGVYAAPSTTIAAASNDASTVFGPAGGDVTLNAGAKSFRAIGINNFAVDVNGTLTLVSGGLGFGNNSVGATNTSGAITNGFLQVGDTAGADTLYVSVGQQEGTTATISAVLQDNGADALTVAKGGVGILVLNNDMTYSGATEVQSGVLRLASGASLQSGNVRVRNSANFEMISGSDIRFNVVDGSTADQFIQSSGGAYTLAGTLNLNFASALNGTWDLFDLTTGTADGFSSVMVTGAYSGSLTETAGVWSGTISGNDFSFTEATGVLTVVPEPASLSLLALASAACLRRRRGA